MENKITKKLIITLGAIVFSFALVNSVSAYSSYYASSTDPVGYQLDPVYYYQQPIVTNPIYPPYTNTYYQQPIVITPTTTSKPTTSVVNNYYYQTAPATKTSTTNTSTNTTSGTPTYIPTTNTSTTSANTSNLGASAYQAYGNGISALSLRGSGGFMPSSIWQWMFVVILILVIIILARMFVRKPDPADHDVHIHNAPAH